jgi:hypothetical protein
MKICVLALIVIGLVPCVCLAATYQQITSGLAYDYSPSWSPDGAEIVFSSVRSIEKIWRVSVDGIGLTKLTLNDSTLDYWPAWSPLGDRIAYCRDSAWVQPRTQTIWTMSPMGDAFQQITSGPSDITPCWSPDGSLIAFSRSGDLWIVPSAGGAPIQLTSGPDTDDFPDWSPDGSEIAFRRIRDGNRDVWRLNVGTGDETRLTDSPEQEEHPSWSPDGCLIAYQGLLGGLHTIFVMPFEGGEPVPVTSDFGYHAEEPDWSPDGSRIALRPFGHYCHLWIASQLALPGVRVTGGSEFRPVSFLGEVFLDTVVTINVAAGSGPILAGDCYGTEATMVDDILIMDIRHPDGSSASFVHDYSGGCQGFLTELSPTYLGQVFEPGIDTVHVTLRDGCGRLLGTTPIYLVSRPGDAGVGPQARDGRATAWRLSPNPSSTAARLDFSIDQTSQVKIEIYNAIGQKIRLLVDTNATPGDHSVLWDGRDDNGRRVTPGVYFSRGMIGRETHTLKVIRVE